MNKFQTILLAASAAAALGLGSAGAWAQAQPGGPGGPGMGPGMGMPPGGPGMGMHGPGHGPGHHPGMRHRGGQGGGIGAFLIGPRVERMLDFVKATPEQRAEIRKISGAARDELKAQRTANRAGRDVFMNAWGAAAIDTVALERERQRQQSQREQMSKRMMQAVTDIGKVLTADQRKMITDRMKAMKARQERRARRGADARATVELREAHAGRGHGVDARGEDPLGAIAAQIAIAEVVHHDEDHIGAVDLLRACRPYPDR